MDTKGTRMALDPRQRMNINAEPVDPLKRFGPWRVTVTTGNKSGETLLPTLWDLNMAGKRLEAQIAQADRQGTLLRHFTLDSNIKLVFRDVESALATARYFQDAQ